MTDEQIQALTQLKELKEQGILSQEEFEKEKAEILNGAITPHQEKQVPQDEPNSIPNTSISENKTIGDNGNNTNPSVKKKKSWFARNWGWEFIALGVAMALVKIIMKLVQRLV